MKRVTYGKFCYFCFRALDHTYDFSPNCTPPSSSTIINHYCYHYLLHSSSDVDPQNCITCYICFDFAIDRRILLSPPSEKNKTKDFQESDNKEINYQSTKWPEKKSSRRNCLDQKKNIKCYSRCVSFLVRLFII